MLPPITPFVLVFFLLSLGLSIISVAKLIKTFEEKPCYNPPKVGKMEWIWGIISMFWASEYRNTNTPFIVARHYDKEHPHCHIVFSRVDYDGKILTQTTNFKKNERVCKALNRKHQLMQGKSKLNTDVSKLRGKEKSAISSFRILPSCFSIRLSRTGIPISTFSGNMA